jgi:hypothetical protein
LSGCKIILDQKFYLPPPSANPNTCRIIYDPLSPKQRFAEATGWYSPDPEVIICFDFSKIQLLLCRAQEQANRSLGNLFRTPISIDYRLLVVSLSN